MYIARVKLNPRRAATKRLAANVNRLHGAVLNTVPPTGDDDRGRPQGLLWRLDHGQHAHILYVASPVEPDLTAIQEEYGWVTGEGAPEVRDYTPRLSNLSAGQMFSFRLAANPTHKVVKDDSGRKSRVAHVTRRHKLDWLQRRGDALGFEIVSPELTSVSPTVFHRFRKERNTGNLVTVAVTTFEGHLRVTDADRFRSALSEGVGRAKAYGCGLMTVVAAQ